MLCEVTGTVTLGCGPAGSPPAIIQLQLSGGGGVGAFYDLTSHTLRGHRDLPRPILIGAEPQQRGNVSGTVQFGVILEIEQLNIPSDGDGNDSVTHVAQLPRGLSAGDACRDHVGVDMAAIRARDGMRRIVIAEEDSLYFPGLQCLQHPAKAGDAAPVGFGEVQSFAGF